MHQLQKILLKRLLVENGQKYSTLTQGYNFEENVVFHLKQLVSSGFIEKLRDKYYITANGTKAITTYDLGTLENMGFKTFFLGFLCRFEDEYLLKEHLSGKLAFYNLPSDKPRFGEKIEDALVRAFHEISDVKLSPESFVYVSLHLKTIKTSYNETLFDDAFAIYEVTIKETIKDKMKLNNNIKWFSTSEIKKLKSRWPEIDYLIIDGDKSDLKSYQFVSDYLGEISSL